MRDGHWIRFENFDLERMTHSNIIRVGCAAITAGASRQGAEQVDLGEELNKVSGSHRACLHEILVRVLGEAGAHEDVEHIMDVMLDFARSDAQLCRESARQIRMAAVIIIAAAQHSVGIGVAARTDNVVNTRAIFVPAIPAERIVADGRHGPEIRHGAPQPIAGADVRRMKRARFPAEEALGEIV